MNPTDWLSVRIARSCIQCYLRNVDGLSPIAVLARLERLILRSEFEGWTVNIPIPFPDIKPDNFIRASTDSTHIRLRKFPSGPNFGDDYVVFINEQLPSRSFIIKLYSGKVSQYQVLYLVFAVFPFLVLLFSNC